MSCKSLSANILSRRSMKSKPRHIRSSASSGNGFTRNGAERARDGATAPAGAEARRRAPRTWLYGFHSVLAAFANPRRRAVRLVMTQEAEGSLGARLARVAQSHPGGALQPEVLSREAIARLVPRGAVHQGVAALVDGLEDVDIDDICRALDGQDRGWIVVLDQVSDPHNVGAILRSAAAFAAAAVVVPARNAPDVTGALAKAASGALETVPLVRVVNLARALASLKKAGFWCVGLDAAASTPIHEADISGKIALVLGAEGEGLRRLTRESCDLMVRIPLAKGMESLNVSNAAAVALYELARRG